LSGRPGSQGYLGDRFQIFVAGTVAGLGVHALDNRGVEGGERAGVGVRGQQAVIRVGLDLLREGGFGGLSLGHGGGGGVGHLAVQIASAAGADVVATASPAKHDFVRGLGASQVIDYHTADFTEVVHDADIVFDTPAATSATAQCAPSAPVAS
jgi:NADPH:quinone reductase-like Zn-dependent oxidoreductase